MRPTKGEISVTFGLGAGDRLVEAEEQRQVAVNAFLLQLSAALMPSQVEAILMRMRSFEMP